MNRYRKSYVAVALTILAAGCGGGGGGGGDMLIEGTLTQGAVSSHRAMFLRHGQGQPIEEVEVCGVGQCSRTDTQGRWGFIAPDEFRGGPVEFSFNGHGINTTSVVNVPVSAADVFVQFEHSGGEVSVVSLEADGEVVAGHSGESSEQDHEHSHS